MVESLTRRTGARNRPAAVSTARDGGVTVANLQKLLAEGKVDPEAETVLFNTGDGLKTIDAISDNAAPTAVIPPTLKGMREAGLL